MKTVYCDLCGQQLTEAEVEGTARLPAEPHQRWWQKDDELVMYPSIAIRRLNGRPLDACWRCVAEHLLAVAPPRSSGVPRCRPRPLYGRPAARHRSATAGPHPTSIGQGVGE